MKDKINVVKILNFPLEDGSTIEISGGFSINESKSTFTVYCPESDSIEKRFFDTLKKYMPTHNRVSASNCALYVLGDDGTKYTLFDFFYIYEAAFNSSYISIALGGILHGTHVEDVEKLSLDKFETILEYKHPICLDFTYKNIHLSTNPIKSKDGLSEEELEWMGELFDGIYTKKLKICLCGEASFKATENVLWGLSEYFFLRYEDMFFYNTIFLYANSENYKLNYFRRSDSSKLRKKALRTKAATANAFCHDNLMDFDEKFCGFMKFREESKIVFDVFRNTVYNSSFEQDYPTKLSQTLDGLAEFLKIHKLDAAKYKANCKNAKPSRFEIAISSSLTKASDKYNPFSSNLTQEYFCSRIKEHRHTFSHVKYAGGFLDNKECSEYSEILYTTIRVLITKRIQDLI